MKNWKDDTFEYQPPKNIDAGTRRAIIVHRDLIDLTIVFLRSYRETMIRDQAPLEPKYLDNVRRAFNALRCGHRHES